MPVKKSIPQQLNNLIKNIEKTSNGQALVALDMLNQTDNPECIFITIHPKEGPYKCGKFSFEIILNHGYPTDPPAVTCHTNVYHPNIEHDVCLSMLSEWTSDMDLEDIVMGLLYLMQNPQLDDPLNTMFEGCEKYDDFVKNVRKSLKGRLRDTNGIYFERNWHKPTDNSCTHSDPESEFDDDDDINSDCPLLNSDLSESESDDEIIPQSQQQQQPQQQIKSEYYLTKIDNIIAVTIFGVATVLVGSFLLYRCVSSLNK